MKEITILFKNEKSHNKHNILIIDYLNNNHQNLNKLRYKIRPIIITDKNIDNYTRMGVTGLPALIPEDDEIKIGSTQIINFLTKCCIVNTSNKIIKPKANQFDNLMMEYALNNDDDGDNDDEHPHHLEQPTDVIKKMDEFNKQRITLNKPKQHVNRSIPVETKIKTKNKIKYDDADQKRAMEAYGLDSDGEPDNFDDDDDFDMQNYDSD